MIKKYGSLIIIFILIALGAFIYFFWLPKYNEYKLALRTFDLKTREYNSASAYLSDMEAKLSALNEYEEQLSKINNAIPVYDLSEVSLLGFIQKVSSENGMILDSIKVATEKTGGVSTRQSSGGFWGIKSLAFNAQVSGAYSSFKDFLKAIYLNSRMIEVNSVTFVSPDDKKENDFIFDLELGANYYTWETAAAPASPAIQ